MNARMLEIDFMSGMTFYKAEHKDYSKLLQTQIQDKIFQFPNIQTKKKKRSQVC